LPTSKGWKMKVDMSPQAVTARLKLLDQLWELSVKLLQVRQARAKDCKRSSGTFKNSLSLWERAGVRGEASAEGKEKR